LTDALPGLLAKAPGSVDRWFFVRYRDPAPHLRVRVHGRCEELNAVFLPAVHEWTAGLLDTGLIGDAVLATYRPEIARYGGAHAMEAAERAFQADSEAVLELLTLRRDGLLDLPLEILLAANMIDIVAAVAPDGWTGRLLTAFPKDGHHEAFRRHRARALPLLDPALRWEALAAQPGGERLRAAWRHRRGPLRRYGELLRDTGTDVAVPVGSLLHMHHNRLAGIDPRLEGDARAVARGAVQVHLDRERHVGR
jgi:thiopeptide-type bacteriocin biosynthesis protein